MNTKIEPMKLVFTSYRDSIGMEGLKVSMDKHAPKLCSYPTLNYLIVPTTRNLTIANMGRIIEVVLDNNWSLVRGFIDEIYDLGIRQLVLCCWCTKEQIAAGRICESTIIGRYIKDKANRGGQLTFPIEIEYGDGREML